MAGSHITKLNTHKDKQLVIANLLSQEDQDFDNRYDWQLMAPKHAGRGHHNPSNPQSATSVDCKLIAERFTQSLHTYKNYITMYETVNLKNAINVTLSNVTDHNTSPFLPTFHIMVWRSKEEKAIKTKLLPLVDGIGCFALLFVVKMLLFVNLQDSSRLYYISTNSI